MPDRSLAPDIKDAVEYKIELKRPDTFSLDNGVKYTMYKQVQKRLFKLSGFLKRAIGLTVRRMFPLLPIF